MNAGKLGLGEVDKEGKVMAIQWSKRFLRVLSASIERVEKEAEE